jgi:hypothetical protein
MRPLFLFLRVVALMLSIVFAALGLLHIGIGVWVVTTHFSLAALAGSLVVFAGFGGWMTYLGTRALVQQCRLAFEWWRMVQRERALPAAKIVLR